MFILPLDVQAPTDVIWWSLFHYYMFLGFAAGTVVTGFMVYWIAKGRQKNVKEAPKFHEESGWGNWKNVVLTLLVTGSVLGFVEYQTFASVNLVTPPVKVDPIYINVTGQQFAWIFTYGNGHVAIDNLTVPVNEVIVLNITSVDVDHSFTIPSLSVAKDAIPGQYNFLWFNATNVGQVVGGIRCKELCGIGHATMIGNLDVVSQASYNKWYASFGGGPSSSTTSSASNNGLTAAVMIPLGAGNGANFSPPALSVASGTTVTFTNQDTGVTHNVDFTSVPAGSTVGTGTTSPSLKGGNSYSITLTTPGTYTCVCDYHNWMKGTITVTK
ncbi:MAG: cupredoxin domain-containing protein [Nitrososphaerales archaeon]|jgi:heme/copper-type cytochrome/quinol oxidase subunit 2